MFDIAGSLKLIENPSAPSLVQIDLLQSVAFLIAWSTLLIAITARIVGSTEEVKREVNQLITAIESSDQVRDRQLAETKKQNAELLKSVGDAIGGVSGSLGDVISQNRLLREENDKLRQILSNRTIDNEE